MMVDAALRLPPPSIDDNHQQSGSNSGGPADALRRPVAGYSHCSNAYPADTRLKGGWRSLGAGADPCKEMDRKLFWLLGYMRESSPATSRHATRYAYLL
jgi:hypothetical protein